MFLSPHSSGFLCRIAWQMIEAHCMIEYCAQLTVNRFQICLRISFPMFSPIVQQFPLPCKDVFRLNLQNPSVAKIRQDPRPNDMRLRLPGIFPHPVLLIYLIDLKETGKGHI